MGLISGVLKKLKIAPEIKIYFQKWPGTDAASGIADVPYKFWVDGSKDKPKELLTAKDGSASVRLKEGETAILEIFGTIYHVKTRKDLEPIDKVKGVQRRLAMLAYGPGGVDGSLGLKTDRAALNFQGDNNPLDTQGVISATSIVDTKTKDALKKAADS